MVEAEMIGLMGERVLTFSRAELAATPSQVEPEQIRSISTLWVRVLPMAATLLLASIGHKAIG